ncbi:MAG: hypothetical protein OQL20_03530 [Sedimenticola sp.]|nr:hypothetical protein [Sedimenticola sp.]
MTADIEVGAVGWEHADWQSTFYPDDLPGEWQLSYYANEFSVVQIPAARWLSADDDALIQWHDDVHEAFRFIIDITGALETADAQARLQECLNVLGDRVAGMVSWVPLSKARAEHIESLIGPGLLMQPEPLSPLPEATVLMASNLHCRCLLMASDEAKKLMVLRQVMEQGLLGSVPGSPVYLIISGAPPEIKVMKDAEVLQQLLKGVAG